MTVDQVCRALEFPLKHPWTPVSRTGLYSDEENLLCPQPKPTRGPVPPRTPLSQAYERAAAETSPGSCHSALGLQENSHGNLHQVIPLCLSVLRDGSCEEPIGSNSSFQAQWPCQGH